MKITFTRSTSVQPSPPYRPATSAAPWQRSGWNTEQKCYAAKLCERELEILDVFSIQLKGEIYFVACETCQAHHLITIFAHVNAVNKPKFVQSFIKFGQKTNIFLHVNTLNVSNLVQSFIKFGQNEQFFTCKCIKRAQPCTKFHQVWSKTNNFSCGNALNISNLVQGFIKFGQKRIIFHMETH